MAIIWITHDLGIIAGLAQRVNVMYGGFIVEEAPVKELYGHPQHPYTLGLIGSLPRLDASTHTRLVSIDGIPPILMQKPTSLSVRPALPLCRRSLPAGEPAPALGRHASPGGLLGGSQDRGAALMSTDNVLLRVDHLVKHFPITEGILVQRQVGAVQAVDDVSFDIRQRRDARPGGRVRLRQVDHRPHDPAALPADLRARVLRGHRPDDAQGLERCARCGAKMQMIFQDPYASLNPRMTVGEIVGEPLVVHKVAQQQRDQPEGRRTAGPGRA